MIKMAENEVVIRAEGLQLEGLLENVAGDSGVVVTHPHPQYGGDMHNNVVDAIVGAYRKNGYSTLRFNFRGVGASKGAFDNGIGEQEDVRAAIAYLSELGKKNIDLAGYSFGAWVNALGLETFEQVSRMIMVSPPVGLLDFDPVASDSRIKLVIAGSRDIGNHHPVFDPFLEVDVFVQGNVRPIVNQLNGLVDGADSVDAAKSLDDTDWVPVNVVIDHVVTVLKVLAF